MQEHSQNVYVVDHAIVQHSLGILRNKDTEVDEFRFQSDRLCRWLFEQSIHDLELETFEIETPLARIEVGQMDGDVVVIPVYRAGIAMLHGALQALPKARVGFAGLKRDEQTAVAHEYYWNIPEISSESILIITDPMLATGGTIHHVLNRLASVNPKDTRVVCVVAAPEGIQKIHADFPQVKIFTAAIDSHLNDKAYIVPGLGDYGDRYFGT